MSSWPKQCRLSRSVAQPSMPSRSLPSTWSWIPVPTPADHLGQHAEYPRKPRGVPWFSSSGNTLRGISFCRFLFLISSRSGCSIKMACSRWHRMSPTGFISGEHVGHSGTYTSPSRNHCHAKREVWYPHAYATRFLSVIAKVRGLDGYANHCPSYIEDSAV